MSAHSPRRGRIDVHHHYLGDHYVRAMGYDRIAAQSASGSIPAWTPEVSLELMGAAGIETAILSVSAPGVGMDTPGATAALARDCNEGQARVRGDHPGRFGFFAALPLPHIDAALAEIAHALDVLDADGVGLLSNYGGIHIGDPAFWPVFEELDRRGAIAFVHPTSPHSLDGAVFQGVPHVSPSTLEFPFETTRAVVSMLVHGAAARFARVRMIWSHAGGAIPYLAGRANVLSARHPHWAQKGPDGFLPALRTFYFDATQSTSPATFGALAQVVGLDRILFGSDVPFAGQVQLGAALADLPGLGLTPDQAAAFDRGVAIGLMPRYG